MGPEIKPANKSTDDTYTPQDMEMKHSKVFAAFAPGIVNSGNLAHKWSVEGDHSNGSEPPSNMRGE